MPTIVFNGKTYNSLEEMPVDEKRTYEQMMGMFVDKNGNGIPDFLEGDMVQKVISAYSTNPAIQVSGKTYHNLDELPPELRQSVDGAFQILSKMGILDGIPNQTQNQFEEHASKHTVHNEEYIKSTPFVSREYNPAIEEESSSNFKTWLIAGIAIMACLGVVAVAVFVFMFL